MIGALLGLGVGIGALIIVLGITGPGRKREARASGLHRLIDRAGLERVGPSGAGSRHPARACPLAPHGSPPWASP